MASFGSRIDCKVKSGTVSNWEMGRNLPNNERLLKIADLGGITVDELLYGSNEDYIAEKVYKDIEKAIDHIHEEFGSAVPPKLMKKWAEGIISRVSINAKSKDRKTIDYEIADELNSLSSFTWENTEYIIAQTIERNGYNIESIDYLRSRERLNEDDYNYLYNLFKKAADKFEEISE